MSEKDRMWVLREREREREKLQNEPHALPKYNQTQEYKNLSRNTTKLDHKIKPTLITKN